jgi:hypothetical protein
MTITSHGRLGLLALLFPLLLPLTLTARILSGTLAAGEVSSLLLMPDGRRQAWGGNAYCQFGDGITTHSPVFTRTGDTDGKPRPWS